MPKNKSRLSDNAFGWMLGAASIILNGLEHDETVLRLHPEPAGPQHNEQKNSWLAFGLRKLPGPGAIMHKSVYRRFDVGPVVLSDTTAPYRPVNMNEHVDFVQYYDPKLEDPNPPNPAQKMADDIEEKWLQKISPPVVRAIGILILLGGLITAAPECRAEDASNPPPAASGNAGTGQPAGGQPPSSTTQAPSTKPAPTAFQEPVPDCAGGEEFKILANTTNSSAIVYNSNLVPAGTTVDFGLTTLLVPNAHYFVLAVPLMIR
jgi:hypothetical protein